MQTCRCFGRICRSDGVGADAGFAGGEGVAGAVEGFVGGVVVFAEGAEVVLAGPAVDGEVCAGDVGVAQELCSQIVGRGVEELGPGAAGTVGGLKSGDLLLGNLELPDNDEHARLRFCPYGNALDSGQWSVVSCQWSVDSGQGPRGSF